MSNKSPEAQLLLILAMFRASITSASSYTESCIKQPKASMERHLTLSMLITSPYRSSILAMPYSVLIFISRKSTLTPTQFHEYLETKHIPLILRLAGGNFPSIYGRRYIARTPANANTAADGTNTISPPFNDEYPAKVLWGPPDFVDCDVIVEHVHDDEAAFEAFVGKMVGDPATAKEREEDENQFIDTKKMRAVVVGESLETRR